MSTEILVLYYSRYGEVQDMAQHIARGVESVEGCLARIRTVPPVSPTTEATDEPIPESGATFVTHDDLVECHGLAMGSPTRYGNMAAPLKHFIDTTGKLWMANALEGKTASVFTSTASMHGGQETTLMTMMLPLFHLGYIIVGLPYTEKDLTSTTTGGTPYGPSHYSGEKQNPLSDEEKRLCFASGKRLAEVTKRLKK